MSDLTDVIDIFDVLASLGMQNIKPASGGTECNFSCPFPGHAHGDERPSAYMNVETTAWFCQGCKERGKTVVSFVARTMDVPYATAENWLRDAYGVEFKEPEGGSMVAEMEARFAPPAELPKLRRPSGSWLEQFSSNLLSEYGRDAFRYFAGRGFELQSAIEWGIGYDMISDRLTIPVHDLDGELVGIKARALRDDQQPRYWVMGDVRSHAYGFDPYEASEHVFGLHRNRDVDLVVLCEGELNAIALSQVGIERPIALGMSYMTDRHAQLIASEARTVVVFFDSDKAGIEGLEGHVSSSGARLPGIVEKLLPHMIVRTVEEHEGDPAKLLEEDQVARIHELIANACSVIATATTSG